jgi:hypothetical protein
MKPTAPAGFFPVRFILFFCLAFPAGAESVRTLVAGSLEVSPARAAGSSLSLGYNGSALVALDRETRFFRGVELEITAPAAFLSYRGSLAAVIYAELDKSPGPGVADIEGRRLFFEPLPNKIQIVYQIPLRNAHGLRTSPYAALIPELVPPPSFPILIRLMPVDKGLSEEFERMVFTLTARPILSDEGAVRISPRYPPQLANKPFTVLIDDVLIENPREERLLKEGEHSLVILSDDYRNESRRFLVERGKALDLGIELQDPTPLLIFEAPENARIYLDNQPLPANPGPTAVEPGSHELRFQVGDYSVVKPLQVQKGRTYRVSMTVDVNVSEGD